MLPSDKFAVVLEDLTKAAPPTQALMHVYNETVVFNRYATDLLQLRGGDMVSFKKAPSGCGVLVGRGRDNGYVGVARGRCIRISSKELCRRIAAQLQGTGTYRIEPDNRVTDFTGTLYYSVFFRKYGK